MEIKQFTDDALKHVFEICTSTMNILELLGYEPYKIRGQKCKEILKIYANQIGVNIEDYKSNNIKFRIYNELHPVCKTCGKDLTYFQYKQKQEFCCSSCAATYNNKHRILSKNILKKFSQEQNIEELQSRKRNYVLNTELIKQGKILNDKNITYKEHYIDITKLGVHICQVCGNTFIPSITVKGNISKSTTCSDICHKQLVSEKSKQTLQKLINDGRHKGWMSRNITSYPENFWINVLNNNHIVFTREFKVKKRCGYYYFLDFFIEHNGYKIDLEIDGQQQSYRKEHDIKRDEYLTSLNYIVYRIEWNTINTENGKLLMKEKIDNFLNWFNNLE